MLVPIQSRLGRRSHLHDGGVDNLANDALVRESDDKSVLRGIVLVLVLSDECTASLVIGFTCCFVTTERKRRMVSTRDRKEKRDEKCALEKCARSRGRDDASRARPFASREKYPFQDALVALRRDSRSFPAISPARDAHHPFFTNIASPPPFSTRVRAYKIEKRTRSSSRELHLIPTQVRIRFVHGIRLLFRFSFTHGAMMIRSRGALLVAF